MQVRRHFADEEPDWDEDPAARVEFEFTHCSDLCERCGHAGHHGPKCPTVNPVTLKLKAS